MILSDAQRLTIQFVQAANSGGYRPTAAEVDEWRLRPGQQPGKRGRLISRAQPGKVPAWVDDFAAVNSRVVAQFLSAVQPTLMNLNRQMLSSGILGAPGTPALYEPDGPPEAFLDWLIRLSLLAEDDRGGFSTTPLSRALLRAEDVGGEDAGDVFVLAEGDPLAYATLLGHVAEMGQVLVVDPYLKPEQLFSFLQHTNANRFLIGSRANNGTVVAMQTLLSATGWDSTPQLRQADPGDMHDRYILGDTRVYTLGMSLNAVGRTNTTVLMPLPDDAADHVRAVVEALWVGAHDLGPLETLPASQAGKGKAPAPNKAAVDAGAQTEAAPKKNAAAKKATVKKAAAKKATVKKAAVTKSFK